MPEKKIKLEEIWSKYKEFTKGPNLPGMVDLDYFKPIVNVMICEGISQALKLAAENALTEFWGMHDYHGDHDCFGLDEEGCYKTNYTNEDGNDVELSFHFDKQSILDTIKQVE